MLRYPPGTLLENLPVTGNKLGNLTAPQLQATAGVLGLPALPGHPRVDQRRNQIYDYLGVPH
ncbi:hypothetical protein RUND412_003310 [Rhizina undulata]